MQAKNIDQFKTYIEDDSKEFLERLNKDGVQTTLEFSSNSRNIPSMLKFINQPQFNNSQFKWIMYYCETCKQQDITCPIHVEIVTKGDYGWDKDEEWLTRLTLDNYDKLSFENKN